MKILKQNYRVVSEKGNYSLEIWLLEVPPKERVFVQKLKIPSPNTKAPNNN